LTFRATEVTRAVKALRKAGIDVARVDFTSDGFSIVPGTPAADSEEPQNELNQWKARRARSA
jgi:biotin operon repressor